MKFKWTQRSEKEIEDEILTYLKFRDDVFAFKVQTQAQYDPKLGIYRKLNKWVFQGTADILALTHGCFVAFEVKSETGRQTDAQKEFEQKIKQFGGHYYLVRCLSDVQKALGEVKCCQTQNMNG